jgi:sugar phosphate permease
VRGFIHLCLSSQPITACFASQHRPLSEGRSGFFGYASTTLSGWGLGKLVQTYGWDAGFIGMLIVAAIGTLACAVGWRAKAHGYGD